MIGDEDRVIAKGVTLLREFEKNLGLGERPASLQGKAELHGRHIARPSRACQAHGVGARVSDSQD